CGVDVRRVLRDHVDVKQEMVRRLEAAVQFDELEARLERIDELLHLVFDRLAAGDTFEIAKADARERLLDEIVEVERQREVEVTSVDERRELSVSDGRLMI